MRTDLEVLNLVDLIITTRTSDNECVSEAEEQMRDREAERLREKLPLCSR